MKHLAILLPVLLLGCSTPRPTALVEQDATPRSIDHTPRTDRAALSKSATEPSDRDLAPGAVAHTEDRRRQAAHQAVRAALPFVADEGNAWMEGRVPMQEGAKCVSCHHVGYAVWSHAEARRAGIVTEAGAENDTDDASWNRLADRAIAFLQKPTIPRAMSASQVILAEPERARVLTDHLLGLQFDTGYWEAEGQFPTQHRPIEASDTIATLYALLALTQTTSISSDETRALATVAHERANAWLAEQPEDDSTELVATHLLLASALGQHDEAAALRKNLITAQHPDGGWGWAPEAESEALSTGQALYALATTGPHDTPAVDTGIDYLLERQEDNGSWDVPSAMITTAPSEHKDQIYRFWGTTWATIGLARATAPAERLAAYP